MCSSTTAERQSLASRDRTCCLRRCLPARPLRFYGFRGSMAHPTQSLCTLRTRRRRRPRNTRYRAPATAYPDRSLTGRTTPAYLAHKQSIASARKMDCFVAALLAMTASAARGKFASPAAKISHLHLCPTQAHVGPSRKAPSPIVLAHIGISLVRFTSFAGAAARGGRMRGNFNEAGFGWNGCGGGAILFRLRRRSRRPHLRQGSRDGGGRIGGNVGYGWGNGNT